MSWSQLDLSILITGGNLKPKDGPENSVSLNSFLSISELKTTPLTGDLHGTGGPPSVPPCCASFQLHSQSYCSVAFVILFGYFHTLSPLFQVPRHAFPTYYANRTERIVVNKNPYRWKFCILSQVHLQPKESIIVLITVRKSAHTELSSPQYLSLILFLITLAGNMIIR